MSSHSHAHAGHSHAHDEAPRPHALHAHSHADAHHDTLPPVRVPAPERVVSAMLMSAPARLAVAAGLVAGLWGLVLWAMTRGPA